MAADADEKTVALVARVRLTPQLTLSETQPPSAFQARQAAEQDFQSTVWITGGLNPSP